MKIVNREVDMVRLELNNPFKLSFATFTTLPRVWLTLDAIIHDQQFTGHGEASIDLPFVSYDAWDMFTTLEDFDYDLVNLEDREKALSRIVSETSIVREVPAALAAINMAVDDIVGQYSGQSIAQLYGATASLPQRLVSIGIQDSASGYAELMNHITHEGGIPKLKGGQSTKQDTENLVMAAKATTGRFAIDFNAGYNAIAFLQLVEQLSANEFPFERVVFMEQPTLKEEGLEGLVVAKRGLQQHSPDAIVIADETFMTKEDAFACARNGIGLNYKIQKIGGIYVAKQIEADLQEEGLSVPSLLGGTFPSALGRAYDCHAARVLHCQLPSDGVMPVDGYVAPSQQYTRQTKNGGLGLTIDKSLATPFLIHNPEETYKQLRQGLKTPEICFSFKKGDYATTYALASGRNPEWNINRE